MRWNVLIAVLLLCCGGCGGGVTQADDLNGLDDQDRTSVQVATSRQLQIGYQILAVGAQEDALDFCHEMCGRAVESCSLSMQICDFSKQYEAAVSLTARCRVSRERCRQHTRGIPRQCACHNRGAS